jgi:hypothetical protein
VTLWGVARATGDKSGFFKSPKTLAEHGSGDGRHGLCQIIEAARPLNKASDNGERPAIPNYGQGAG